MRAVFSAFSIAAAVVVALSSCTGETDYDVLDDYNATNTDPTVAAALPADAGTRATTSRGVDAGTVAHRPDASAPTTADASPPPPPPAPPPPPPSEKKKGKHHDDP
jgi:hypothetical protein